METTAPRPSLSQNRNGSTSALKTSKGTNTGKGLDVKTKPKKLDSHLEPIQETIELQPPAIQDTLGNTTVAMLLATYKLQELRAGLVNMTRNLTSYPCSCSLKAKLAFPQDMKEDPQTQKNVKVWDNYVIKTKDEMKK